MNWAFAAAAVLVSTVGAAPPAGAQADGLAAEIDQLSMKVEKVQRRLKRTRASLRASRARIATLEQRVDQGLEPQGSGLQSADGRFVIDVSNAGIRLRGPSTTLELTPASAALTAPLLSLGAPSGCPPVARLGDSIRVQYAGELLQGTIIGGSTGVFAC